MSKKCMLFTACLLAVANVASAAVNVPDGLVGLWLLDNGGGANPEDATIGSDLAFNHSWYGPLSGTNIQIGTESTPFLYQETGLLNLGAWTSVDVSHSIGVNGGGATRTNEYSWLMDYRQAEDKSWASLFDTTDGDPHGGGNSDGELFNKWDGTNTVIGRGDLGYSTSTYDPKTPHRLVVSADIGNFFRVYIDGVLFLDSTAPVALDVDGDLSLPSTFHFLVDNTWEVSDSHLHTAMLWDHALSGAEVAAMGSFVDPSNGGFPTPLIMPDPVPEPTTLVLFGLGLTGMLTLRRRK